MEFLEQENESIPLYSPRTLPPPSLPPQPSTIIEKEEDEKPEKMTGVLAEASHRIGALCNSGTDWQLMESEESSAAILCFVSRSTPRRYRLAGLLQANAATIVAWLKDHPRGIFLKEIEQLKASADNVQRQRFLVHLPGPLGGRDVEVIGYQHCVFMEDTNRYLYTLVSESNPMEDSISFLLGVWIHELDSGQACEIEAVFEWQHVKPTLWTWVSDGWLETIWMIPENLAEWAQFYAQKQ